ncbi:MAG: EpsI family protein [Gemmataceae bacterium]|nr:EpsI family protein [Gemmataceae bacterium]MCI0739343.1 EpsI family protein [Gemmataceae bacterium]
MRQILLTMVGLALLVSTGVVHGLWTDRWEDRQDLTQAGDALKRLPLSIGDWDGEDMEVEQDSRLALAGSLTRRYRNRNTGQSLTIYIGCGRPGPVAVHTPDVCYAGAGFEVERPKAHTVSSAKGKSLGDFWTARILRQRADGQSQQRIFWSWHAAGQWRVADNPRLAFAGEKILHKLYVLRDLPNADEPLDADYCVEFLRVLVPAMQKTCLGGKA